MIKPKVIWITGLSGAGKTNLSKRLQKYFLEHENQKYVGLDGDVLRKGLCSDLGFSDEDRRENIRRVAELSKVFMENGQSCICSFISPTKKIRALARKIIGDDRFIEVYVNTPLEVCEKRDVKGLYKKARSGEIKKFTGIDSEYEAPENPEVIIDCSNQNLNVNDLYQKIKLYLSHLVA